MQDPKVKFRHRKPDMKMMIILIIVAFCSPAYSFTLEIREDLKTQRFSDSIFFGQNYKQFSFLLMQEITCRIKFHRTSSSSRTLRKGTRIRLSSFMTWRSEKISQEFYGTSIWARVQDHPKIYGLICQKIGSHLEKPTLEEIENASGGRVRFI